MIINHHIESKTSLLILLPCRLHFLFGLKPVLLISFGTFIYASLELCFKILVLILVHVHNQISDHVIYLLYHLLLAGR